MNPRNPARGEKLHSTAQAPAKPSPRPTSAGRAQAAASTKKPGPTPASSSSHARPLAAPARAYVRTPPASAAGRARSALVAKKSEGDLLPGDGPASSAAATSAAPSTATPPLSIISEAARVDEAPPDAVPEAPAVVTPEPDPAAPAVATSEAAANGGAAGRPEEAPVGSVSAAPAVVTPEPKPGREDLAKFFTDLVAKWSPKVDGASTSIGIGGTAPVLPARLEEAPMGAGPAAPAVVTPEPKPIRVDLTKFFTDLVAKRSPKQSAVDGASTSIGVGGTAPVLPAWLDEAPPDAVPAAPTVATPEPGPAAPAVVTSEAAPNGAAAERPDPLLTEFGKQFGPDTVRRGQFDRFLPFVQALNSQHGPERDKIILGLLCAIDDDVRQARNDRYKMQFEKDYFRKIRTDLQERLASLEEENNGLTKKLKDLWREHREREKQQETRIKVLEKCLAAETFRRKVAERNEHDLARSGTTLGGRIVVMEQAHIDLVLKDYAQAADEAKVRYFSDAAYVELVKKCSRIEAQNAEYEQTLTAQYAELESLKASRSKLEQSLHATEELLRHSAQMLSSCVLLPDVRTKLVSIPGGVDKILKFVEHCTTPLDSIHGSLLPAADAKELLRYKSAQPLARGSFGTVYTSKLRTTRIALKELVCPLDSTDERNLAFEIITLSLFSSEQCLASCLGHFTNDGKYYVASDFAEYGDLWNCLRNHKPTASQKLRIAIDLATGLESLHRNGMVHRDLKPGNCLVYSGFRAKLADFGTIRSSNHHTTLIAGTMYYLAPEVFEGKRKRFAPKAEQDVFAMGYILFELWTEQEILPGVEMFELKDFLASRRAADLPPMDISEDCPWRSIVLACWQYDPGERISSEDLLQCLQAISL